VQDFRNLKVWEKAHLLALAVYRATEAFPARERYGMTSQLRRAAYSVPGNLAEGCGRGTDRDFARHVQIALGSASELEYFLLLARDLGYLEHAAHETLEAGVREVKRMLAALVGRLTGEPVTHIGDVNTASA
jgi:four helix bundle protein